MIANFIKVYFNRITMWIYLGAFLMFMMFFYNPYINVFLLLSAIFTIMFGCTYVIEEKKLTAGERVFINKIDKLFDIEIFD